MGTHEYIFQTFYFITVHAYHPKKPPFSFLLSFLPSFLPCSIESLMTAATKIDKVSETSPGDTQVMDKYKQAGEVANRSLQFALTLVKPQASVLDICQKVDEKINALAAEIAPSGAGRKGIAFPCCVSINETLCNFTPLDSAADIKLKEGDLVKVELGAHIDGFPAMIATTIVVGDKDNAENEALLHAVKQLAEAGQRALQPGSSSVEVVRELKEKAAQLQCLHIEGIVNYTVGRDTLAGNKMFVVNPTEEQARILEPCKFAAHDVVVLDIAVSLPTAGGTGKVRPADDVRPTVYRRTGESHGLRLKTSRAILHEVTQKFGTMAFTLRQLDSPMRGRLALTECCQNGVAALYDVLRERQALTARLMMTVVVADKAGVQPTIITSP